MSVKVEAPVETVGERILFATVLLWSFLSMCFPLYDTDFWWHLKTGQWILEGNGIPYVDLYTFTDSEKPWVDLHWGFQVLIAILYRLGGVPLVTLVKSGIITAAVAFAWRAGGTNLSAWKKAALWLLPIICIAGRGNERPEMLSQLFLALWLWIARETDRRPGLIWYLPLLQVIWVNCHALFVLGLVVGFCYAVDAVVCEWANGRFGLETRTAGPDLRLVGTVGLLVAIACLMNPYFEEGALFPLTLYRKFSVEKDFYCQNIGEFRPPIEYVRRYGLRNLYLLAEVGTWLLTFFSFFWLLITRRKWSLFRLMLFAGFSHLAWQASRNTNIFAIVSGFIACENFADACPRLTQNLTQKSKSTRSMLSYINCTNGMTVLLIGLCVAVVTGYWNQIAEKNKPFGLGEAPNWFIHDPARFASQPGFPHRAFISHIGQAEVYVYHNAPQCRVFMDARLEVCTQRTFEHFNQVLAAMAVGDPVWQTRFHDGELPVVILDSRVSRPAINGMMRTPGWRLVFADRSGAVFLANERADQLGLRFADPTPLIDPDGKMK